MAKVSVVRCSSYDLDVVEAAFRNGLAALGDNKFVSAGQRVALKANLLQAQVPERGMTTHPAVVHAVARWVREQGATPVIVDSPGGPYTGRQLRKLYETTGMMQVADQTGAELNYDLSGLRVQCPEGRVLRSLDIAAAVAGADAVINLPKLKTHGLLQLTCAVKNLFGVVPGLIKGAYHARFPSIEQFSAMLVDIVAHVRPVLNVVDAVVGMEGDGPSAGTLRQVGLMVTGSDTFAVDLVCAHLVGMNPEEVQTIAAAVRRGLSSGRVGDVEIVGSELSEVRVAAFRPPSTGTRVTRVLPSRVPSWLVNQLLAQPGAGHGCTGCGVCVTGCPVGAIRIIDGRAITDLRDCVHCYCCHELCPERAVELHHTLLGRLVNLI